MLQKQRYPSYLHSSGSSSPGHPCSRSTLSERNTIQESFAKSDWHVSNYINESLSYKSNIRWWLWYHHPQLLSHVTMNTPGQLHGLNRPCMHVYMQARENSKCLCVPFNLKEMHIFEIVPRDLCARPTL